MGKDMADAPIFIVGCPRSGTNLLRDLLRSHPRLAFPGESHFIPEFYKGYGDPKNEREARRLGARILRVNWVRGSTRRITMPERVMWEAHNLVLWSLIRVNTAGNHRLLADYAIQKWAALRQRLRAANE
jgi:Sulfotransferase family